MTIKLLSNIKSEHREYAIYQYIVYPIYSLFNVHNNACRPSRWKMGSQTESSSNGDEGGHLLCRGCYQNAVKEGFIPATQSFSFEPHIGCQMCYTVI